MAEDSELAGRRSEVAYIERVLDVLGRGGACGALQVLGEPGIGKTRLLAELGTRADRRGYAVVAGRAAELEHDLPFGVFADALDPYLASLDPRIVARLGPPMLAELATAFPSLAALAGEHQPALQAERFRTHRAVRSLLEELGWVHPTVVLLDDAHWADPASRELFGHLLAYPPKAPVLLAMALRPAQAPASLNHALAVANSEGRAQGLLLGPLSRTEAEQLMGTVVRGDARSELYRESGGNPFYLEQLIRAAATDHPFGDRPVGVDVGSGMVPPAVRAALAAELDSLSAPARNLLNGAAVAGDPFETDLAAEVADVGESDALALIDTLLELDLIRPTPAPRRFRFRHPIVRRAVYESTGAGWRLGAHARAASTLQAAGAPTPARAHHVERSGRQGDDEAIAVLVDAGDATAPRAPATAGHWYGAAIRLLPNDDPRRIQLLVSRATALGAAGQLEASHAAVINALELLAPGPGELRVALTAFAAGLEMLMGRLATAGDRLLRALDQLDDRGSIEAAALEVELSVLAFYSSDCLQMGSWAEQALRTSRRRGYKPLEVMAAALRAYAGATLADPQADELLTEAAALFDEIDDACLAQRIDAAVYLGWAESLLERFDDSFRHLDRGIHVSRATGQGQFVTLLTLGQAVSLMWQGRVAEARELTSAAVEASRLGAPGYLLVWALLGHTWVCTYAGDVDRGVGVGLEAAELLRSLEPTVITAAGSMFLGMALLEAGEPARAYQELHEAIAGPPIPRLGRTLTYDLLTRAALAIGHVDEADEWASRAQAATHDEQLSLETSLAHRARAAVLLARGEAAAAAELALGAARRADQAGARVEAARARLLAGKALARTGQRERAVAALEAAQGVLSGCGAQRYAAEAAAALRRLGRRQARNREKREGWASLSEREREIAELVAAGRSNREIAASCCVSVKTVERHLSNMFGKLEVRSRAGLASVVGSGGERSRP